MLWVEFLSKNKNSSKYNINCVLIIVKMVLKMVLETVQINSKLKEILRVKN